MSHLELRWRERERRRGRGRHLLVGAPAQQTDREYLDFVIDGDSLWDQLFAGMRRGYLANSTATDLIGCLGWSADEKPDPSLVAELLLERELALMAGRTRLYICPECGDIGCGAITAIVEESGDEVVWGHFRYENDYDESMWVEEDFSDVGPFHFRKSLYLQALRNPPSKEIK